MIVFGKFIDYPENVGSQKVSQYWIIEEHTEAWWDHQTWLDKSRQYFGIGTYSDDANKRSRYIIVIPSIWVRTSRLWTTIYKNFQTQWVALDGTITFPISIFPFWKWQMLCLFVWQKLSNPNIESFMNISKEMFVLPSMCCLNNALIYWIWIVAMAMTELIRNLFKTFLVFGLCQAHAYGSLLSTTDKLKGDPFRSTAIRVEQVVQCHLSLPSGIASIITMMKYSNRC